MTDISNLVYTQDANVKDKVVISELARDISITYANYNRVFVDWSQPIPFLGGYQTSVPTDSNEFSVTLTASEAATEITNTDVQWDTVTIAHCNSPTSFDITDRMIRENQAFSTLQNISKRFGKAWAKAENTRAITLAETGWTTVVSGTDTSNYCQIADIFTACGTIESNGGEPPYVVVLHPVPYFRMAEDLANASTRGDLADIILKGSGGSPKAGYKTTLADGIYITTCRQIVSQGSSIYDNLVYCLDEGMGCVVEQEIYVKSGLGGTMSTKYVFDATVGFGVLNTNFGVTLRG